MADQPPPAYTEKSGTAPPIDNNYQNHGYQSQPPVNQGYQPGYPPQGQPGYPPQGQPGYPPQGQPGYPPQGQSGYPPAGQPAYAPQEKPGYPPPGQPGYPPPGQQGYQQPPPPQQQFNQQSTNNTTTIIQQQAPPQQIIAVSFGEAPVAMVCPACRAQIITAIRHEAGGMAWLICVILFLFVCWPCACIPFCVDSCQDVVHSCPNCRNQLGIFKRL